MSGVALAVGLGSAVIGGISSSRASKAAAEANAGANRLANIQGDIAQEQWNTYKTDYRPLEQGMLAEAKDYDSPERQEQMAGMARTDAGRSYGQAAAGLGRRLAGYGAGDPSGGNFASQFRQLRAQGAGAEAGAANMARMAVQDAGWGRRLQMANIGRGMAGTAGGLAGNASQALSGIAGQNQYAANQAASGAGAIVGAIGQGINNFANPRMFTAPGMISTPAPAPGFNSYDPNFSLTAPGGP